MLAEWLCVNRKSEFITVYREPRSKVLLDSLNHLRGHLKSCSLGAVFTMLGPNLSPLLGGRQSLHLGPKALDPPLITSTASANPRKSKTESSLVRRLYGDVSEMIGAGGGSILSPDGSRDLTEADFDLNITEREIFSYMLIVTGLFKLMQLELRLIETIIPVEDQKVIFSEVVGRALDTVIEQGESLTTRAKKSFNKQQDFNAALHLLPVLR